MKPQLGLGCLRSRGVEKAKEIKRDVEVSALI
jgi:hypothetical protein